MGYNVWMLTITAHRQIIACRTLQQITLTWTTWNPNHSMPNVATNLNNKHTDLDDMEAWGPATRGRGAADMGSRRVAAHCGVYFFLRPPSVVARHDVINGDPNLL